MAEWNGLRWGTVRLDFQQGHGQGTHRVLATMRGDGNDILMGTARGGHWVSHLVTGTRREHIAGGCVPLACCWRASTLTTISCTGWHYVNPSLDVPEHATTLKTNSLHPTYLRPHSNRSSEGAPALSRTTGGRESRDLTLFLSERETRVASYTVEAGCYRKRDNLPRSH